LGNPCIGFSMASYIISNPCKNELICQKAVKYNFIYGFANFAYVKDDLYVYYYFRSGHQKWSLYVIKMKQMEILCILLSQKHITINFTSMCTCPGKCPNKTIIPNKWVKTDSSCTYKQIQSGKEVNLQGLDTPWRLPLMRVHYILLWSLQWSEAGKAWWV